MSTGVTVEPVEHDVAPSPTYDVDRRAERRFDRHPDSPDDADVADHVESLVGRHPWLEKLVGTGWAAKGVVYALMGFLAVAIARADHSQEDASPEGALSIVMERSFGSPLLTVLAVGLVLYSAWRFLSVAMVRGHGLDAWLHRIGYTFSASFYAVLAWTAARAVWVGHDPERSNTVERLSRSLMDSGIGRMAVLIGGLIAIGVGLYFAKAALARDFLDDLETAGAPEAERKLITAVGTAGLLGRALVTSLVGLFVTTAAINADPSDARGFDRSLRHLADGSWGSVLVMAAAVGLVVYGIFCLVSLRHRRLS